MEVDDEQCVDGMATALDTARGLHDKVRLALGALRLQGSRLPQRLEQDLQALDAVRAKLQQLEDLLEECYSLPPGQYQQQADMLCSVDQTRGDLIATCRQCAKFVVSCQELISEVLEFCEIRQEEDVTPREFTTCWRAAAVVAANADRATTVGPASTYGTIISQGGTPLRSGLATEVTSAPPHVPAAAAAASCGRRSAGHQRQEQLAGAAASGVHYTTGRLARDDGAAGAAVVRQRQALQREQKAAGIGAPVGLRGDEGATGVAAAMGRRDRGMAGAAGGLDRGGTGARRHHHHHPHRPGSGRQRDQEDETFAFEPAGGVGPRGAAAPHGATTVGHQQLPQQHVRYAGVSMHDRGASAAAAAPGGYRRVTVSPVIAPDDVYPQAAIADSTQFGGKVSLQRYARGQGEGSEESGGVLEGMKEGKSVNFAELPRAHRRRDTDGAADVRGSREVWLAASHMVAPPRMRVLQDAVTMSREDLQRLNARSKRRSWLVGIAKALGGLAAVAALAAASVITVRTALDDYNTKESGCDTEDIQLEPLAPRLPSLGSKRSSSGVGSSAGGAGSGNNTHGAKKHSASGASTAGGAQSGRGSGSDGRGGRGGGRGNAGSGASGGSGGGRHEVVGVGRGLMLQMPQMPYVPVFPAPNALDSRS